MLHSTLKQVIFLNRVSMAANLFICLPLLFVAVDAIIVETGTRNLDNSQKKMTLSIVNETDNSTSNNDDFNYYGNWFRQRLDHFTVADLRTWEQRYWVRKEYYVKGGPVFLKVGAEWAMSGYSMIDNEAWQVYAETHHAMMFQLEHRFYGDSHPTSDMSDENLKFLSTQQAVADIAQFISSMNRCYKLPNDTRWVVFGCSCSATLAAWARYKYPHLVFGAVASSAPVWTKPNFPEYLNVARESFRTYGNNCVTAIQEAFQELDHLLVVKNGSEIIKEKLSLCDPLDVKNEKDVTNMYEKLANQVMEVVQTNKYVYWTEGWTIDLVCDVMVKKTSNNTSALGRFVEAMQNHGSYPYGCLEHLYSNRIQGLRDANWTGQTDRQYIYQMCSEIGYFQTAEDNSSFLGSRMPMKFYHQLCADAYGKQFTKEFIEKAVDHAYMVYGGVDLQATRVIYVHGSIDPWQALGITKTKIPESPAIFIKGVSHCGDVYASSENDPDTLTAARKQISDIIGQWIKST